MRVLKTGRYDRWMKRLRDRKAKAFIVNYFDAIANDEEVSGDIKGIGDYVTEARFHYGPGYRVYYTTKGNEIMLLLVGGDKSTQSQDVKDAKRMAKEWRRNA